MMSNKFFTVSLLVFGLILLGFSYIVYATDTGYESAISYGGCYDEFSTPDNALLQNDQYATSLLSSRNNEEDWFEFDFSFPVGCPVIDGIIVEFDAYGSVANIQYDVSLTWDSCGNFTSVKNSGNLPLSDTDTYIVLGSSSDDWGYSNWDVDKLLIPNFHVKFEHVNTVGTGYLDHVRIKVFYTSVQPDMPSCYWNFQSSQCNKTRVHWAKGTGADYTLVKYKVDGYPTFLTGTELYNGTGSYADFVYDTYNEDYYFTMWSWNATYCRYSNDYDALYHSPCSPLIYQTNYNIVNATGTFNTSYDKENGWTFWINYTSCINIIENLSNTTGGYEVKFNGSCNNIYSNYSTLIFLYENIVNATGTLEAIYKETTFGFYEVWANYTGNDTGVSCGMYYYNYSDDNITLNITVNCCNLPENTTNYSINEDNWFDLMGTLTFDNEQFSIFVTISLFFFFFSMGYNSPKRSGGAFMLLSGFMLIGLEFLISNYINPIYIAPLITPFAGLIMILGVRKWLYPTDKKKVKTEGQ